MAYSQIFDCVTSLVLNILFNLSITSANQIIIIYTCNIVPECVTSGGAHLCSLLQRRTQGGLGGQPPAFETEPLFLK